VENAVFFGVICWGCSPGVGDSENLNKLMKKADSAMGPVQEPQKNNVNRRMLHKLWTTLQKLNIT